jgi:large subunit ribosomal protein L4
MAETVSIPVVSQTRQKVGEITVPAVMVAGPVREHLLHAVVQAQRQSRRAGTVSTKTRHFVSGGGKKPWRQKGTGRARAGSIRSPLWAGGAIIFGPQPRDWTTRLPRSARKAALRSALADRHAAGKLVVVDRLSLPEPKTKRMVECLHGLGFDDTSVLVVVATQDDGLQRAARNLPHVKILHASGLNVYDVLRHAELVITRDALEAIAGRLGKEAAHGA